MELQARTLGNKRGFALIIAVSLLALLVLVLIAMATLTRVETSVAVNSRMAGSAQQNALYALSVALGELQRHAGADTRITATAGILSDPAESPYLTGVWNSQGGLRTWLVSGNEMIPDSIDARIDADLSGRMTPSVVREQSSGDSGFEPLEAPDTVDERRTYVRKSFRLVPSPGQPRTSALLVGPYSAGHGDVGNESKYVVAPLIDLHGPVTGEDSERTVGRYAWWVGDEGVKAKANIRDPYSDGSATIAEQTLRRVVAQRVGIEQALTGYPVNNTLLERVVDLNQLPFIGGVGVSDIRDHFHDFTTQTLGVIADVRKGGLKKDLNRVLAEAPPGFEDSTRISAAISVPGDPQWGSFRSFYNQRASAGSLVMPSRSSNFEQGLFPLVTAVSLWPGAVLGDSGRRVVATLRASVVLSNPYDVRINAAHYRIELPVQSGGATVEYRMGVSAPGVTVSGIPAAIGLAELSSAGVISFITEAPVEFEPGEAKVFSTQYADEPLRGGSPFLLSEGSPPYTTGTFEYYEARRSDPLVDSGNLPLFTTDDSIFLRINSGFMGLSLSFGPNVTGPWSEVQAVERIQVGGMAGGYRAIGYSDLSDGEVTTHAHSTNGVGVTLYLRGAAGLAAVQNSARNTVNSPQWLAHHSPRAPLLGPPTPNPWVFGWGAENPLWDGIRIVDSGSTAPTLLRDVSSASWGRSFESTQGSRFVGLFHVLRDEPQSLGQFQHASFSVPSSNGTHLPAYPFANSYASPYVAPDEEDLSYALNDVVWDEFFVSGFLGDTLPEDSLPNSRLVRYGVPPTMALNYESVAGHLLCDGSFNVNSTSVDAWAAMLASLNGIEDPRLAGVSLTNPFFRTPEPVDRAASLSGGTKSLSQTQTIRLAAQIVNQVRSRGPFLSMSDFVNRDLSSDATDARARSGALQAAIDSTSSVFLAGTTYPPPAINPPSGWSSPIAAGSIPGGLPFVQAANGRTGTLLPQWLSQADVLTALGPSLSVRSDTFLLRCYGESVNPLLPSSHPDYVVSRAWCEAVVQRIPDYVDYRLNADGTLASGDFPWESGTDLNDTNRTLGRRFVITSFRWLSPDDI